MQFRRDTAANWTAYNPILLEGELGFELDTDQYKLGDGVHNWINLPYRGLPCVQQMGLSTTTPMSQKAVTEAVHSIVDSASQSISDLDISDENGNVVARFSGGNFKTKNFDSSGVNAKLNTIEQGAEVNDVETKQQSISDLDISDENGNVVARFSGGHIKTKNFDSAKIKEDDYFKGKKLIINGASTDYGSTVSSPLVNCYSALAAKSLGMSYKNYAIGGTCWSKKEDSYDEVYYDYNEWLDDVANDNVDTSKKYFVKDGNYGSARPWHIYRYTDGTWKISTDTGRTPLVDRIREMDTDADVILIGGSAGNDWMYTQSELGTVTDETKYTILGATRLMCQYLLETYPQKLVAFVFFGSAWRYQPNGVSNAKWDCITPYAVNPNGNTYAEVKSAIMGIISQYGFPIIDLKAECGMSPYYPNWWCGDTDGKYVHPNAIGHTIGAQVLVSKLKALRNQLY